MSLLHTPFLVCTPIPVILIQTSSSSLWKVTSSLLLLGDFWGDCICTSPCCVEARLMTSLSGVRDLGFSGDLDLERDFGIGEASDKSLSISTLGKTCKQFFTLKYFQTITYWYMQMHFLSWEISIDQSFGAKMKTLSLVIPGYSKHGYSEHAYSEFMLTAQIIPFL